MHDIFCRRHDPAQNVALQPQGVEFDAAVKLCDGLEKVFTSYATSSDSNRKKIHQLWVKSLR